MQVDPIKPTFKAPGTERLKLKYDKVLASFAFNFNLRRYTMVEHTKRVLHLEDDDVVRIG